MNRLLTTLVLLLTIAACGGSDSPTGPGGGGPHNGSFTATIDGTNWAATAITPALTQVPGGFSAIGAGSPTFTVAFAWPEQGTGTYTIGQAIGMNANLSMGGSMWTTTPSGGGGTLTITTRTATQVSGTFSFTMVGVTGTTGTRAVTNGAFTITF